MRLNRTIVVGTGSSPNAYLGILSYWSNSMKHLRSMIIMKQIRGKSKITGRFQQNSWMKDVRSVLWQGIVMEVTDVLRREDRYICICVHTMILPERSRASVEDVAPVRSWLVVRSWRKRKKKRERGGGREKKRETSSRFCRNCAKPLRTNGEVKSTNNSSLPDYWSLFNDSTFCRNMVDGWR